MPMITTDFSIAEGSSEPFFKQAPEAEEHLNFHIAQDDKRDGRRKQLSEDDRRRRAQIDESQTREGYQEREHARTGAPYEIDDNGKRQYSDWHAPYRQEQARLKAGVAANAIAKQKIGRNESDELVKFCAAAARGHYRAVPMPFVPANQNSQALIRQCESELRDVTQEQTDCENANRTDQEVDHYIRNGWAGKKLKGSPHFGNSFRGGTRRANGSFTAANPNPEVQYPTKAATVHQMDNSVFVEVDDVLCFLAWADVDDRLLNRILDAARTANAGTNQISEADKVKALREIAVRKLAAQRNLEAVYRHAEAQGLEFKRRPLPPEVLLWVERVPPADQMTERPHTSAAIVSTDKEFDFEDSE